MEDVAIYGAGGFGREVACLLRLINERKPVWNLIGFFDDALEIGSQTGFGPVLGGMRELNAWPAPLSLIIAVGYPSTKMKIISNITSETLQFPNIIAPDTILLDPETFHTGKGNIICSRCWFSCNIRLGDFNIFNGYITVGHDVRIGDHNSFMPSSHISGDVTIGNSNFFGVAATVLQGISVGNRVTVGANSLIIRKTKDSMTYLGNPATLVKY